MLKIFISGRLGGDAEVQEINSKRVINFSVAHTRGKGDKQRTDWFDCSLWREPGKDGVASYLKKGTPVVVEGVPESSGWLDKSGNVKSAIKVLVQGVDLMGSASEGANQPNGSGDDQGPGF